MEPTIYKPSIYKGAGIYKTGAEGGGGGGNIVHIGSNDYEFVQIGNLYVINRNLDELFSGINFNGGSDTYANSKYIMADGQEQTAAGLFYNNLALDIISSNLPDGWRLPKIADMDHIYNVIANNGLKIRSKLGWGAKCFKTNDEFGLSLYPTGRDNQFITNFYGWYEYSGDYNYSYYYQIDISGNRTDARYNYTHYLPVRLFKDV